MQQFSQTVLTQKFVKNGFKDLDHDGFESDDGGIEAWIGLGKAVGLSRKCNKFKNGCTSC